MDLSFRVFRVSKPTQTPTDACGNDFRNHLQVEGLAMIKFDMTWPRRALWLLSPWKLMGGWMLMFVGSWLTIFFIFVYLFFAFIGFRKVVFLCPVIDVAFMVDSSAILNSCLFSFKIPFFWLSISLLLSSSCSSSSNSISPALFALHISFPPAYRNSSDYFCLSHLPTVSPLSLSVLSGFPAAVIFNWCFCAPAFILWLFFFSFLNPPKSHLPCFSHLLCLLPVNIRLPCLFLCDWISVSF